jgi:hypothetical protein
MAMEEGTMRRAISRSNAHRGARVPLLPACGALLAVLAWSGVANAQVACGDRIGAGSQAILAGNLTCAQGEVLTVEGPAVLDLNGFVVRCTRSDGFSRGIVLVGRGATVKNGFVQDCETGILLAGDGRHRCARSPSSRPAASASTPRATAGASRTRSCSPRESSASTRAATGRS